MKIYEEKEILLCPYCGEQPDGGDLVAEDFVIPNSDVGSIEHNDCGYCYGEFVVKVMPLSRFAVYGDK